MTRLNLLLTALIAMVLTLGALGLGSGVVGMGEERKSEEVKFTTWTHPVPLVAATGTAGADGAIETDQSGTPESAEESIKEMKRGVFATVGEIIELDVFKASLSKNDKNLVDAAPKEGNLLDEEGKAVQWFSDAFDESAGLVSVANTALNNAKKGPAGSPDGWKGISEAELKVLSDFIKPVPEDGVFSVKVTGAKVDGKTGGDENLVEFRWVPPVQAAGGGSAGDQPGDSTGFWFSADEMENAPVDESNLTKTKNWQLDLNSEYEWLTTKDLTCRMPRVAEWHNAYGENAGKSWGIANMDAGYGEWVRDTDGAKKVIGSATMPDAVKLLKVDRLTPMDWTTRAVDGQRENLLGDDFDKKDLAGKGDTIGKLLLANPKLRNHLEIQLNADGKELNTNHARLVAQRANEYAEKIRVWQQAEAREKLKGDESKLKKEYFRYRWLLPKEGITITVDLENKGGAS